MSSLANLIMHQKAGEKSHLFGLRVWSTVQEFFTSFLEKNPTMDRPRLPIFPEELKEVIPDPDVQQQIAAHSNALAIEFFKEGMEDVQTYFCMTVFLNGLSPSIQVSTKAMRPRTMEEAMDAASTMEYANDGPSDELLAEINRMYGEGAAPRSSFSRNPRTTFPRSGPLECWYCRKKNHRQSVCLLRIDRGAAMVSRPRTIWEIKTECMINQELYDDQE